MRNLFIVLLRRADGASAAIGPYDSNAEANAATNDLPDTVAEANPYEVVADFAATGWPSE